MNTSIPSVTSLALDSPSSKHPSGTQDEDYRCRICYDHNRPLVSVCECSGSIAYVHEDCILDWITKKIENSATVDLPTCEICHQKYRAHISQGSKKVSYPLLKEKISELGQMEIAKTAIMALMVVFAVLMILSFLFSIATGTLFSEGFLGGCEKFFLKVVCQWFVGRVCYVHFRRRKRLFDQSIVQVIQITLQPKQCRK